MKKITKATIKSFIRKNKNDLYIKTKDRFNGMIDMVDDCEDQTIRKVTLTDDRNDYNFGIKGAWFVGSSRDYFNSAEFGQFKGYEVYNCVGTFYLLVKENK